ncbi:glycoside hydrolase family 19 protein [Paraburkholderia rhizosphaerae]|uniref:Chitinase class I n=1 Tax=Paraburkholderia rhizosphaerae TaxID=480658 RepID=A0A4R8L7J9_9BURK|nr:glycoside hydrolase family 19 protein [Paraburkholderia rhizosphaerae]TDY38702.1 chitinase class I [Paraburkholderia rhizosphaerae]
MVHHIHPVALVGNFAAWKAIDIDMFVRLYKPAHSVDFGWYSKENSPKSKLPPLSKKSEENLRALLHWINELYLSCHRDSKIEYIAYMLATARVEAYDFQAGAFFGPISEIISYETAEHQYGCGPTAAAPDRARNFGNTAIGDGHKYRGRGLVQITWKINYERFSKITGVDLVANPDAALDWKNATSIMIEGMLTGAFTGKKLADFMFINNFDYKNARKIINGIDKNIILAEYAEKFAIILRRCI